ncbi:hypothetical protein SAMN04488058_11136 [Deinococcus reticulitermitis]|uniref:Uncharacterized protein n=1 Tax=Deinococcus reticulitermitis TaxID=856736 RepID=A0A1H7AB74_9DEIO|nr:hypothetical protein [Deinococcus reticulitermitis]SEJ58265.1 hypothetical protein SAMN04488058_11136 [Deinococcus reticulitermitis]
MRRRLFGVLAVLILLGCLIVIVLDGQGAFGQIPAPGPWPVEAPASPGSYGEMK